MINIKNRLKILQLLNKNFYFLYFEFFMSTKFLKLYIEHNWNNVWFVVMKMKIILK